MKKSFIMALALVLVLGIAIGGTVAWLTAETDPVTNTFTVGDINISLAETWNTDSDGNNEDDSWSAKLVPGNTYAKDPKVTVAANSEACWLFVEVTASENLNNYVDYSIRTSESEWKQLTDGNGSAVAGVYYREVSASDKAQDFYVLTGGTTANTNGQVTIKSTVTKDSVKSLTSLTLTFKAYAIQKDNFATAYAAWQQICTEYKNATA